MKFLHEKVFDPVLSSPRASEKLKQGVRLTIVRLNERDAKVMIHHFWSAVSGTERSVSFAVQMRTEGFDRFEEALEEFRERFPRY